MIERFPRCFSCKGTSKIKDNEMCLYCRGEGEIGDKLTIYLSKKFRLQGITYDEKDIIHDKIAWEYCK